MGPDISTFCSNNPSVTPYFAVLYNTFKYERYTFWMLVLRKSNIWFTCHSIYMPIFF